MNLSMKIHIISTKIKLLGKVDNLYQILSLQDAFYCLLNKKSFGLAALEAMARNATVISSNANWNSQK